jgi:hypothetical protein
MILTEGKWSSNECPLYFAAGYVTRFQDIFGVKALNIIPSVYDIRDAEQLREFDGLKRILLDSGVFTLASNYARKLNIPKYAAFSLKISEIPEFQKLFDKYVSLVKECRDMLWGYIEIDIGGRESKKETTKKLLDLGLRPIPVFHPVTDGWEYFYELAENYDRISMSTTEIARSITLRIIQKVWELSRKYPKLWIHILGITPGSLITSYPFQSYDSSSWMSPIMYTGGIQIRMANDIIKYLDKTSAYNTEIDSNVSGGYVSSYNACINDALMLQKNLEVIYKDKQLPCKME